LRFERWRQFGIAASLYVLLGGFFAAVLANDLFQSILIGASWTSYIGTLGLKRDSADKGDLAKSTADALLAKLKERESK
jgi:hypothetical protein